MPRPRLLRKVRFNPKVTYFKPQEKPMVELEIAKITMKEIEFFRLRFINKLDQRKASQKIHTFSSTYQRILYSASKK
ncbi:MAG: DUF134 domain-containing protein [Patescibacteria group bacterium]|nr:DUF134 domain-containing protein [Patescibacteria group bacterium]